jgi:hypothetical protein
LKATQTLRRWLLFWKPVPRPAQAEESLAALLARRDEVRARKTEARPAKEILPSADLFKPKTAVKIESERKEEAAKAINENAKAVETKTDAAESTTSRLLEAKRRARKNLK